MQAIDLGNGPPVLLLHGQPGWRHDWDAVATELAPAHRVIVPDRPGYGLTGGAALGIVENADAAVALLDDLGVEQATVAGHSWGGGVALAMAQRHPSRVNGLVLVASIGALAALGPLDSVLAAPIAGEALAWIGFHLFGRLLLFRRVQSLVTVVQPRLGHVAAVADHWRTGPVWRSFVIEQRAMVTETPAIAARLESVRAPTTVLVGNRDAIIPPAASVELAGSIPGARLERIPHHGHLLLLEVPERVAAAIAARARVA
jgi:pimeloyl-ACP methyl ester carboxylesterase